MFVNLHPFFETNQLLLAPMAGVSDRALRLLCAEQGADLCYTEMVSSKALSFANEKTRHLLDLDSNESIVAVQLFGHEPDTMAQQAVWVEDTLGGRLAYLDINMGCPARKIATKGDGAALMKDPAHAFRIIDAINRAVEHPVTVKFRRGYEMGNETAVDFARMAESAGASAVTVHGRYAQQLYRGEADWKVIKSIREAVSIPVIGNGDIKTASDLIRMKEQTGCSAFMIARAAQGNPWIFAQARAALAGEAPPAAPLPEERVAMARRHARLLAETHPQQVVRMRKHAQWYTHGLPRASTIRQLITSCVTLDDFDAAFDQVLGFIAEQRQWDAEHGYPFDSAENEPAVSISSVPVGGRV